VAGITHSVACNITDQHISLKVHNTQNFRTVHLGNSSVQR